MNCYFFVDGSALLGDLLRMRRDALIPQNAKLNLSRFASYFTGPYLNAWHGGGYRRFVFYFVHEDARLEGVLVRPQATIPGAVNDLRVEYCGKRVRQYEQANVWLEAHGAPEHVRECLYRSEKAVDTQICCDALQLAGTSKLDRLFLYTNDYDFVPLFRSIRQLGANANLFRLRAEGVNFSLASEADAFHVVPETHLVGLFDSEPAQSAAPEANPSIEATS